MKIGRPSVEAHPTIARQGPLSSIASDGSIPCVALHGVPFIKSAATEPAAGQNQKSAAEYVDLAGSLD
jgi:hypothetical protein